MTALFELTSDHWTEIGSGPIFVERKHSAETAYIHFAAEAPSVHSKAFHVLGADFGFAYGGKQKCFARAAQKTSSVVVTEGV